jgi:hypothetical protein
MFRVWFYVKFREFVMDPELKGILSEWSSWLGGSLDSFEGVLITLRDPSLPNPTGRQ